MTAAGVSALLVTMLLCLTEIRIEGGDSSTELSPRGELVKEFQLLASKQAELRQLHIKMQQLEGEVNSTAMGASHGQFDRHNATASTSVATTVTTTTTVTNADGSITTTTTSTTTTQAQAPTSAAAATGLNGTVSAEEASSVGCSDPLHCNLNGDGFSWDGIPEPRRDQLPMGASRKTWPNIVNNKRTILFCTTFYKYLGNREKCIHSFTGGPFLD